jgi:hypothetical protein
VRFVRDGAARVDVELLDGGDGAVAVEGHALLVHEQVALALAQACVARQQLVLAQAQRAQVRLLGLALVALAWAWARASADRLGRERVCAP